MEKRVKHEAIFSSELFSATLFCIELRGDLSRPVGTLAHFMGRGFDICKLVEAIDYKMMYLLCLYEFPG